MFKSLVELSNARVVSEAQDVAPTNPRQPPGAGDDQASVDT
jgi:hypothetical protein